MASLTVRQLDEALKQQLRLRAARNGRSMEDEVRTILKSATEETGGEARLPAAPPSPRAASEDAPARAAKADVTQILLIIGGGIAAYKSLDLIRRLRERSMAVRVVMTAAAQKF